MRTRKFLRTAFLWMAGTVAGGSLFAAQPANCPCAVPSEDWNFHQEASQLLREIQSTSWQLTDVAEVLQTYTRGQFHPGSHAAQLNRLKLHINGIGERLARLQEIRHQAAPWQQEALDSILPTAASVAARTSAAIGHLKENPNSLWTTAYTDHLNAIAGSSDRMKRLADLHLDRASIEEQLEELHEQAPATRS